MAIFLGQDRSRESREWRCDKCGSLVEEYEDSEKNPDHVCDPGKLARRI
jgi:formylmethanofuran dehydrogenase subunit E